MGYWLLLYEALLIASSNCFMEGAVPVFCCGLLWCGGESEESSTSELLVVCLFACTDGYMDNKTDGNCVSKTPRNDLGAGVLWGVCRTVLVSAGEEATVRLLGTSNIFLAFLEGTPTGIALDVALLFELIITTIMLLKRRWWWRRRRRRRKYKERHRKYI